MKTTMPVPLAAAISSLTWAQKPPSQSAEQLGASAPKAGQQVVQAGPDASWDPQCIRNGERDDRPSFCFSRGELRGSGQETKSELMKLDLLKEGIAKLPNG